MASRDSVEIPKGPAPTWETVIPWNNFKESEILALLQDHFSILGYEVYVRHFADASHEGGVDLEAKKKNQEREETLFLSTKIKPEYSDRAQLRDLSERSATKRVYVYIKSPAQSFKDEMQKLGAKVEFWDVNRLSLELVKSGVVFELMLDNSELLRVLKSIARQLLQWTQKSTRMQLSKTAPTKSDVVTMWNMKDRSVQLHKAALMAQLVFERIWERGLKHSVGIDVREELLDLCNVGMRQLLDDAATPLLHELNRSSTQIMSSFRKVYEADPGRSNWKFLYTLGYERKEIVPGKLWNTYKPKEIVSPIVFPGEPLSGLKWESASSLFRIVMMYTAEIEETIDCAFDQLMDDLRISR